MQYCHAELSNSSNGGWFDHQVTVIHLYLSDSSLELGLKIWFIYYLGDVTYFCCSSTLRLKILCNRVV